MPAADEWSTSAPATDSELGCSWRPQSSHSHQLRHSNAGAITSGPSSTNASHTPPPAAFLPAVPFDVGARTSLIGGVGLREMVDSTRDYRAGDVAAWKRRLDRDGYVLLRGALPTSKVMNARRCVCEAVANEWDKIDLSVAADDDAGVDPILRARIATDPLTGQPHPGLLLTGFRSVTHDPRVQAVVESEELVDVFSQLFGQIESEQQQRRRERRGPSEAKRSPIFTPWNSNNASSSSSSSSFSSVFAPSVAAAAPRPLAPPASFDTVWVRVHGHDEFTDEHTDYYRFEQWEPSRASSSSADGAIGSESHESGARDMYTCWIPLGEYPVAHGTLAVGEGTHLLDGYRSGVYDSGSGRELPPDFDAWCDGFGRVTQPIWRTAHFRPGDIVIFDIRTIHASTRNTTHDYRISIDTRWKPSRAVSAGQRGAFRDIVARRATEERRPTAT